MMSGTPLIAGNGVWTPPQARDVLQAGADFVFLGAAAIGNPDWPTQAREPGFLPVRKPFTPAHLHDVAVSDAFVRYLSKMPGMVLGGS